MEGREYHEDPYLRLKAWMESDRWRCTRLSKSARVVFSFHTHSQRVMNMNLYTNVELAVIHFIYDLANEIISYCCSFAWVKISNESVSESSNVRSGASESGGTWILQNHN